METLYTSIKIYTCYEVITLKTFLIILTPQHYELIFIVKGSFSHSEYHIFAKGMYIYMMRLSNHNIILFEAPVRMNIYLNINIELLYILIIVK